MGLALASLRRGSNGGFKASSSYRNGGNEMGDSNAPNGGRKPEFGGRAPARPDFPARAYPRFFKLFWEVLIALEASWR